MLSKIKTKLKKETEIVALGLLILITIISTTYYNYNKKKIYNNYKNTINNIYLKKTLTHLFDNLEPKFKKIDHVVAPGETFNSILENYSIQNDEINEIKKKVSKEFNLNKLNTNQKIKFTLDQTTNLIKEFIFQISNTEKIYLKRDTKTEKFNKEILVTKLKKNVVYKENIILQSLYKSAMDQKIPVNTVIEFTLMMAKVVFYGVNLLI